jgi:hypothetical protein
MTPDESVGKIGVVANEVAESIERLAWFLRDHNESFWANKLDQDAVWIRRDDSYGLNQFLGLFGGMGSLNDLVFDPMNGNCEAGEEAALNEQFQTLRHDAWERAEAARHP